MRAAGSAQIDLLRARTHARGFETGEAAGAAGENLKSGRLSTFTPAGGALDSGHGSR
jgi:hypothetical protein